MSRSGKFLILLCGFAMFMAPAVAKAQPANLRGVRVYEEQLRVRLDEQAQARVLGFDAGLWFNFAFFHYDDASAGRDRTLRLYELRPWARLDIQGIHRFYVRGLTNWEDWNHGDNPDNPNGPGDVYNEPRFERAWYELNVTKLFRHYGSKPAPLDLRVKVGREYATIGTAFVLSMPLDLVQVNAKVPDWHFMGMLAKTVKHTNNVDDSPAVADHQQRCIWGVQVTYTGMSNHRPFAYFLDNEDNTDAWPNDPLQDYEYTSRYFGIGSTGVLFTPQLRYSTELVGEWGRSTAYGTGAGREDIEAMAYDLQLEYQFQQPTKPKAMFEYIFASGDGDRASSSTSTIGGNTPGTKDHAFNAFGFRDTGIAFSPDISNINIWIFGGSLLPLNHLQFFKKMEVGSKVFLYSKARTGPISDPTAVDNDNKWLGWEWDVYCNWRITSDLAWTIRYGAFQPGSAFDEHASRHFLYTGATFSF